MAKLTRDDVLGLARLARLQLTDAEVTKFADEISVILGYVEQLQQEDLGKLEPTLQVTGLTNATRPDEVDNYDVNPTDLLKNAPATEGAHIQVKRMLT